MTFPAGQLILSLASTGPFLLLYTFVLVERKYSVLIDRQQFLVRRSLTEVESVIYLMLFGAAILLPLLTATRVAVGLLASWPARLRKSAVTVGSSLVTILYFIAVTVQFEVAAYFRDGLDLANARSLAGGGLLEGLRYVEEELLGLLPILLAGIVSLLVMAVLLKRFGRRTASALDESQLARTLARARSLCLANLGLLVAVAAVAAVSPTLDRGLSRSLTYGLYKIPLGYFTDFDLDGYGLISKPRDHAPFDASRHPYAVEVPGNGIDENGVGGDLPQMLWKPRITHWSSRGLERKNVLLIVLESGRGDLLDAQVDGEWVMPAARSYQGHRLRVWSHVAFSTPSIQSILMGVVSPREQGESLIVRFNKLGYRTGVFSAQHEGFGRKDELTSMRSADRFRDASTEPPEMRMYGSTKPASLKMPARVINERFFEWLDEEVVSTPFFAYINWQETHFPYYYEGAPTPLVSRPLARRDISMKNQGRLYDTYMNAARVADSAFRSVVDELQARDLFDSTVILFVGDHGEELFEQESLGHGTNLTVEQNWAMGKLFNSDWAPPRVPVGLSDLSVVIYNALQEDEGARLPLESSVFCYLGSIGQPGQIGRMSSAGLLRYDFRSAKWSWQGGSRRRPVPAGADKSLVHFWESFVIGVSGEECSRGRRAAAGLLVPSGRFFVAGEVRECVRRVTRRGENRAGGRGLS